MILVYPLILLDMSLQQLQELITKSGTTVVVTLVNHGLRVGESAFLDYTSGTAVDETLSITSVTDDTFTCTSSASVTTAGTVNVRQEFSDTAEGFADTRWTEQRVKIKKYANTSYIVSW